MTSLLLRRASALLRRASLHSSPSSAQQLTPPSLGPSKFGPSASWITAGMMLRMRRPRAAVAVVGRWAEGCLTVKEDDSVAEAVRLMTAHEVGSLVVMDNSSTTVSGILTERSYSRRIILEGRDSETTRVGDVMKNEVVCVNVEEKLDAIAATMSQHGIRHLPVLDGAAPVPESHIMRLNTPASALRGVLSIKDVSWMLFCLVRNELQGRGIGQITASDIMPERQKCTIDKHKTVLDAIRQMRDTDVHALCVLNGEKELLGIVTERDYVYKVKMQGRESINTRVSQIMSTTPWCATPDFTLDDILTVMTTYGFRHLPVVGSLTTQPSKGGPSLHPHCIGLISVNDVLRTVTQWPDRPLHWPDNEPPLASAV